MNLPNKLTMLRILLIPVFMVVLYWDFPGATWVAVAIFIIASFTDLLDGKIARKYNLVTDFGKFADPLADKMLVTAALLWFVEIGQMPAWALLIVLVREFAVSGLRMIASDKGRVIAAGWSGKVKTASTMVCIVLMFMFIRSKYGRAIRAIRNDEIAASAAGINTSYYKVLTFSFSAFFAGVAGALYACANASLSTSSFSFTNGGILNSTFVVVMVVLGGMGSLTGSIFSAVIMYVLNYQIKNGAWVSALPGFLQGVFTYPMLVYALVLVVIIIFRPKGIFGSYEFSLTGLASSLAAKLRGSKKSAAKEAAQHE